MTKKEICLKFVSVFIPHNWLLFFVLGVYSAQYFTDHNISLAALFWGGYFLSVMMSIAVFSGKYGKRLKDMED